MSEPAADTRDWRTVAPFLIGIASFGALALWNESRDFDLWRNYAVMGMVLGSPVTWVLYRLDVRVPHYIQWIIVAGLWLHYGGGSLGSPGEHCDGVLGMHGINGAYHVFPWWDNLTHAVGMGAGAMASAYLLEVYHLRRRLGWPAPLVAVLAVATALAAGVGVELYEYLGKTLFQTIDQGGYSNTMWDLVWNLVGAAAGSTYAVMINRRLFWPRMQTRWGEEAPRVPPGKLLPPSMVGFIAFIAPAAAMSLWLSGRFLLTGGAETMASYDGALNRLTASAVVGILAGPFVAMAMRELRKRRSPA